MSNSVLQSEQENIIESKLLKLIVNNEGSVMGLLESIFNEPVDIEFIEQEMSMPPLDWKDVEKNETILERAVFLKGLHSKKHYAYALSYIRTNLLDSDVVDLFMQKNIGIGNIIKQCHLETYREIVSNHEIFDTEIYSKFPNDNTITEKRYLIYVHKLPVILIKEYYPHSLYEGSISS